MRAKPPALLFSDGEGREALTAQPSWERQCWEGGENPAVANEGLEPPMNHLSRLPLPSPTSPEHSSKLSVFGSWWCRLPSFPKADLAQIHKYYRWVLLSTFCQTFTAPTCSCPVFLHLHAHNGNSKGLRTLFHHLVGYFLDTYSLGHTRA